MYRELYSSEYCSIMQTEALKLWHELEQESGLQLLRQHGLLFYGDTDTGETVQANTSPQICAVWPDAAVLLPARPPQCMSIQDQRQALLFSITCFLSLTEQCNATQSRECFHSLFTSGL